MGNTCLSALFGFRILTDIFLFIKCSFRKSFSISSDELRGLGQAIGNSKENLEFGKALAEGISRDVSNAHTNALKIYTDIDSLSVPEINIPKLKEVAEFTAQEVGSLVNVSVFTK
jgi:hypothetical protein